MIEVPSDVWKALRKESCDVQQLFEKALTKLQAATPLQRQTLLDATNNSRRFKDAQVRWTMRANHKYRLLVDRKGDTYIVRGIAGRGDHRYYP